MTDSSAAPLWLWVGAERVDLGARRGELLAHALRRHAGQSSVLVWCKNLSCGVCRVLINGELVLACNVQVTDALQNAHIETHETLQHKPRPKAALAVFADERPSRCRLCVGAIAVTAEWLGAHPSELESTLRALRCSCTGRASLRRALLAGAAQGNENL